MNFSRSVEFSKYAVIEPVRFERPIFGSIVMSEPTTKRGSMPLSSVSVASVTSAIAAPPSRMEPLKEVIGQPVAAGTPVAPAGAVSETAWFWPMKPKEVVTIASAVTLISHVLTSAPVVMRKGLSAGAMSENSRNTENERRITPALSWSVPAIGVSVAHVPQRPASSISSRAEYQSSAVTSPPTCRAP